MTLTPALSTVSDGTQTATYSYLANSPLVGNVTFKQNTTTRMTTTRSYDYLNRLSVMSSVPAASGQQPVSYSYQYNSANQRTRNATADGSYWLYEYDSLGQVKRATKYFSDGYPVPGQQFEYAHDDIGNRTGSKAGGDENGGNLRPATYTPNNLNQYTSRTVPGAFDVLGVAMIINSTLTVNSVAPWRKGEYFRKELSVVNSSAAVWQSVSVAATGETTVSGNVFVPKTPENFGYDLDGNLTSDGRFTYTWDAENRLTKAESLSSSPTASKRKVVWEFDGQGRRIRQTTYNGSSGSYVVTEDLKFVSDGWRHARVAGEGSSDHVFLDIAQGTGLFQLDLRGPRPTAGTSVELGIRPENAILLDPGAKGAALSGRIRLVERLGNQTLVHIDTAAGVFTLQGPGNLQAKMGDDAALGFDPGRSHLFAQDGRAL